MSLKYTKVSDILIAVLTSNASDSYPIVFTNQMKNKNSFRYNIENFLKKDKVWCLQLKKPFTNRYFILAGDYSRLTNVKYNSKTNSRRDIQRRIVNIDIDINFFETVAGQTINFITHNGYESNEHVNIYTKSINSIRQRLFKQKHNIDNALMSPNISYRAYPRFKS